MSRRAFLVILGGVIVAPLVTWLPMLALYAPKIGLPLYHPAQGIDLWGMQTLWLVALGLIAVLVAEEDRVLAFAVALAGLTLFWRGARLDPTHSVVFAIGALGLWAMRRAPVIASPAVKDMLAWLGLFQAVYMLQQAWFQYDVLWMIWGGDRAPVIQPLGTLGTVDAASAYVAMTAPLMPLWGLPIALAAVIAGKSIGAMLALTIGLTLRYVPAWREAPWRAAVAILPAGALLAWLVYVKGTATATVSTRVLMWWYGLTRAAASDPVLGWGLGGWAQTVPARQMAEKYLPSGEVFREAHSEPVQWIAETGVVGLILLAVWLWTHRAMFRHATWGASISAASVSSLSFFPLHVVPTALVIVALVGLATARHPSPALGGA